MNLPTCPNHRESKEVCPRSDLRLHGENEQAFMFVCHTCKLLWAESKNKVKGSARYENRLRKVKEASETDRLAALRPKQFGYSHIKQGVYQ